MTAVAAPDLLHQFLAPDQHREATIEAVEEDKRLMLVRGAPYDVEIELAPGYFEQFAPGTFARADNKPSRTKLWLLHDPKVPPIGHALSVEDRADGYWIHYAVDRTDRGDEALELARSGTLDEVSVTFTPLVKGFDKDERADGWHIRHRHAHLLGVAMVPHGAYGQHAFIASVRDEESARREAERRAVLARLQALTH